MKAALMSTSALPTEQIPLPHLSRELIQIVEPGQVIPNRSRIYLLICEGDLQMIQFIRGRWYCPRPDLPAFSQALGLQLREPDRPRPATRRSAPARSRNPVHTR
jgi:hypothetical protein